MSGFDQIYNELIARYGAASVLDKAACRQVARVLAADAVSASDLSTAHSLLAQLPKVPEAKPWDLSKLSPRQLKILERLACVAQGQAPPMAEHRPKSLAYWCAVDAAAIIDRVERRGGGMDNLPLAERIELKSNIGMMLSPLNTTIRNLFSDNFEPPVPPDARWIPDEPEDQKTLPEPIVGQDRPSPLRSNVVPLNAVLAGPDWGAIAAVNRPVHNIGYVEPDRVDGEGWRVDGTGQPLDRRRH